MERYLCGVMVCLLGLGLMRSEAFEVEVQDESKKTCISARMNVNFTIQYEISNGTLSNVTLAAPEKVTTDGSTCGGSGKAPLLVVNFGNNHSLSFNFTNNVTVYSIDALIFTYNTNDSTLFPDAKSKGLFTAIKFVDEQIPLNSTYTCLHEEVVVTENVVQVYWNVSVLAYAQDVTLHKEFHCSEDTPTPAPTTPTTHVVTTSNTNTTTTTQSPTTPPVEKPAVGDYKVFNGTDVCLLASMGLQLNASLLVDGKQAWTLFNINPNNTNSSGSCNNE
ncbi:lysosome-associated membrane glycoprotein 2, partial [Leptodactylus fuscus]|uniref:lysosome-associated membrane glycoprotein 2 n=1 Tax=Leptodactylus fuscus TaxID=238119 RepID=UPI003F4F22B9